jgi:hypothetical protein
MVAESAADEERWAQARALLEGAADASVQQRTRRLRRRIVGVGVALVLAAGVMGVLFGLYGPDDVGTRPPEVSTARQATGLVIIFAGLGLLGFFVVKGLRMQRGLGGFQGPTAVLTRAQQRQLLAQVRGRRDADPAHLPLARNLAERMLVQRWLVIGLVVCFGAMTVGQWISTTALPQLLLTTAAAILFGVACAFAIRDARRARAFLAAHPAGDG